MERLQRPRLWYPLVALFLAALSLAAVALVAVLGGVPQPILPASAAPTFTEYPVPTANAYPWDMAIDGSGNIWFTEKTGNKIGRLTQGGVFQEFSLSSAGTYPGSIALSSDGGTVWFTEPGSGYPNMKKIGSLTVATGVISEYMVPGFTETELTGFMGQIRTDAQGNVWFSTWRGVEGATSEQARIRKYVPSSGSFTSYVVPITQVVSLNVGGLAVDGQGRVWFTIDLPGVVGYLEPQSGNFTIFDTFPVTDSVRPNWVVPVQEGAWFTDYYGNRLGFIRTTPTISITLQAVPTPDSWPLSIALDGAGNVWFTEYHVNQLAVANVRTTPWQFVEYPAPSAVSQYQRGIKDVAIYGTDVWFTEVTPNKIGKMVGAAGAPLAPGTPSQARSLFSAASGTAALADGQGLVTLTVTLRDASGILVPGKSVVVTSTRNVGGQTVDNISAVVDNGNGTYTATVSSSTPGRAYFTARDVSDGFLLWGVVAATFAGAVDPAKASLAASPQTARADGSSPITLSLSLVDSLWDPVPGRSAAFASSRNLAGQTVDSISPVKDNGDGTYAATITSTTPGAATFTATSAGLSLQASASFYNPVSAAASTLGVKASSCLTCPLASQAAVPADGQSSALLVVGLLDGIGNPVSGKAVTLTSSLNQGGQAVNAISRVVDRGNGAYASEVTSKKGGTAAFAAVDTTDGVTLTQRVEVAFGPAAANSSLAVSPSQVPADGQTPSTITLALRDGLGNPLSGQSPSLSAGPCLSSGVAVTPTLSALADRGDGTYVATARASSACASSLAVAVGGSDLGLQAPARFAGPASPQRSSVSLSASSVPADGTSPLTITVDLRDAARNPLPGKALTLTSQRNSGANIADQISSAQDLGDGRYVASVRSAVAGRPCLTVTDATDGVSLSSPCLGFVGAVVGWGSWVSVVGTVQPSWQPLVPADGQTAAKISVRLVDRYGSGVSGKEVRITSSRNTGGQTVDFFSPVQDEGGGRYNTKLSSSTPGFATLTVTDVTDGVTLPQQPVVGFYATGGALSGTVADQGGRPVAGAGVTAFGPQGTRFQTWTDSSGGYALPSVVSGEYRVMAKVP